MIPSSEQRAQLEQALTSGPVRQGLFLIRLAEVSLNDRLHQRLIQALQACGEGASDGELITAMRFVFGHEMQAYGDQLAVAKVDADEMLAVRSREIQRETRVSLTEAKRIIEGEPAYWELRRAYAYATQRERYCREMMQALQAALDNHRTNRADQRAADQWHAHSGA